MIIFPIFCGTQFQLFLELQCARAVAAGCVGHSAHLSAWRCRSGATSSGEGAGEKAIATRSISAASDGWAQEAMSTVVARWTRAATAEHLLNQAVE